MPRTRIFVGHLAHDRDLVTVDVGRQLFVADLDPTVTAICRFKKVISAVVNRIRLERRDEDRRIPLETIELFSIFFTGPNILIFAGQCVAADQVAVLRFGIDVVNVVRVRLCVKPVAAADGMYQSSFVMPRGLYDMLGPHQTLLSCRPPQILYGIALSTPTS